MSTDSARRGRNVSRKVGGKGRDGLGRADGARPGRVRQLMNGASRGPGGTSWLRAPGAAAIGGAAGVAAGLIVHTDTLWEQVAAGLVIAVLGAGSLYGFWRLAAVVGRMTGLAALGLAWGLILFSLSFAIPGNVPSARNELAYALSGVLAVWLIGLVTLPVAGAVRLAVRAGRWACSRRSKGTPASSASHRAARAGAVRTGRATPPRSATKSEVATRDPSRRDRGRRDRGRRA